ncbi:MAG: response regulator [bacterium]|nr:response regulator [bacterium]
MEQHKKILIIEDDHTLGNLLLDKLTAEGYTVFFETDGQVGLQKIRDLKPDMVLLDIVLPNKNGYDILDEVSKDPELKKICMIVISGSGQPVDLKRILDLGAKDYLIKTEFDPGELLIKMKKHLADENSQVKKVMSKKNSDIKIMIVEDDPFLSSIASSRMEREGYKISVAMNGEEALTLLENNIPDLILLDIIMPGMNGFEVLKKIKSNERLKDVLIIIFSNLSQEHEIEEAKNLGADDFLIKANFTPMEIIEKINILLKQKGKL